MSIEKILNNLNKQIDRSTDKAVRYHIYYHLEGNSMKAHYYTKDGKHQCDVVGCPENNG